MLEIEKRIKELREMNINPALYDKILSILISSNNIKDAAHQIVDFIKSYTQ